MFPDKPNREEHITYKIVTFIPLNIYQQFTSIYSIYSKKVLFKSLATTAVSECHYGSLHMMIPTGSSLYIKKKYMHHINENTTVLLLNVHVLWFFLSTNYY